MRETWYVLEDGTAVDPREVSIEPSGALRHASGALVAVGPHGPRSRSVDLAEVAAARESAPAVDRQMSPARGKRYQTR